MADHSVKSIDHGHELIQELGIKLIVVADITNLWILQSELYPQRGDGQLNVIRNKLKWDSRDLDLIMYSYSTSIGFHPQLNYFAISYIQILFHD